MIITPSPAVPFRHLQRLTDSVGVLEHAYGTVPRYEHGYRVDDVAHGLVVVCREPSPSAELVTLGRRYLYFLAQAQAADGKFRTASATTAGGAASRRRRTPGAGRCGPWAPPRRAVPPRGSARRPAPGSTRARASFPRSRTPWRSPLSGRPRCCGQWPGDPGALSLLALAGTVIGEPAADAAWPWPVPRLSHANAAIAEAVIVAGDQLGRDDLLRTGLRMLDWLLAAETRNGHLSVVPAAGWGPGEDRPGFDQHPSQVAALADACVRAAAVTGDSTWLSGVELAAAWLHGSNDAGVVMLDPKTGGCSDALGRTGRSRNQGAEATLAMISVLQQGRRASLSAAR